MAQQPRPPIGTAKIVLIILGAVSLLCGLGLAAGGGVVLFVQSAFRDAQGFFVAGPHPFTSTGYAVTSDRLDLGIDPQSGGPHLGGIFTLRLRVAGDGPHEIFAGIGPAVAVDSYLARSSHDEVTDVSLRPFRATYLHVEGAQPPGAPTHQTLWVEAVIGPGEQTLTWRPHAGDWKLAIMNADGSPGVTVRMSVGVRVRFLTWIAIGLLIAALIAFIAGGLMLYFGARAPKRSSGADQTNPTPAATPH